MAPRLLVVIFLVGTAASAHSQACFPVVEAAAQKLRDQDRRDILETELRTEHRMLERARAAFDTESSDASRAEIIRHSENINALSREIARLGNAMLRPVVKARQTNAASRPTTMEDHSNYWNPYSRAVVTD